MGNSKEIKILIAIAGVIALVAVLVLMFFDTGSNQKEEKTPVATYEKNDESRPIADVSSKNIDWGKINLNDDKKDSVTLKNDGKSPLVVTGLSTSCGCTSTQIDYNGQKTKEYDMHSVMDETVSIAPGDSALVLINYRPYTMPVEGDVIREVYIETNDPNQERIIVSAKANVVK